MFSLLIHNTFFLNNTFHTKGVLGMRLSLRKFGLFSLDIKKSSRHLFYFDANIIMNVSNVLCTFILEHETYTPLEWIRTIEFCLLQYKCEFLGRGIGRSKFQGSHIAVMLFSYLPPEKSLEDEREGRPLHSSSSKREMLTSEYWTVCQNYTHFCRRFWIYGHSILGEVHLPGCMELIFLSLGHTLAIRESHHFRISCKIHFCFQITSPLVNGLSEWRRNLCLLHASFSLFSSGN